MAFKFNEVDLNNLVIHKVGNKAKNEGMTIARDLCRLGSDEERGLLLKYFLSPFKGETLYRFFHETDLHLNEMYMYASRIFMDRSSFYEQSVNMLKHLYDKSDHPQIKSGEFYLVHLTSCTLDNESVEALGIFKSENKDFFLKVTQNKTDFDLEFTEGINVKRLDKGCLIFNVESQNGYKISIVDAVKKDDEEALYWKEAFLKVAEIQDESFQTKTYLNMCKNFCDDVYGQLYQADRKDQAVFINKALNYFSNNNEFDLDRFAQEVIEEPQQIQDFKSYKTDFEESNAVEVRESFDIAPKTVKSMKRKFKNLIKLDTDIEIKINPAPAEVDISQFVERGYDEEKGMYYYKVYFNEEQ